MYNTNVFESSRQRSRLFFLLFFFSAQFSSPSSLVSRLIIRYFPPSRFFFVDLREPSAAPSAVFSSLCHFGTPGKRTNIWRRRRFCVAQTSLWNCEKCLNLPVWHLWLLLHYFAFRDDILGSVWTLKCEKVLVKFPFGNFSFEKYKARAENDGMRRYTRSLTMNFHPSVSLLIFHF